MGGGGRNHKVIIALECYTVASAGGRFGNLQESFLFYHDGGKGAPGFFSREAPFPNKKYFSASWMTVPLDSPVNERSVYSYTCINLT